MLNIAQPQQLSCAFHFFFALLTYLCFHPTTSLTIRPLTNFPWQHWRRNGKFTIYSFVTPQPM